LANKNESEKKSSEELKSMINENVQFGLNALEAIGDKAAEVIEKIHSEAGKASQDVNAAIGDFLTQARKAQKETISALRKQTKSTLGNKSSEK
jgi:ElaB/YqjD/DUF883 family membrane-anchored ribosome-binding protein